VVAGRRVGDNLIIVKGLAPGQRIVTSANFLIDSESQLQAAAGSYAPPPPGAGATAAQPARMKQADIQFTTEPDPPRKGDNMFRVKLADANGSPVTGALISVVFYMPAMPAMGMAAMTNKFDLHDSGSGEYAGSGALQSGGSWRVTITAQKNGQRLAVKQLRVNATGGM
jgi:Cu(I)/Ag(I) efflux system membrane fusion protein/cobalt-zinc-cadmium efflux system membrane fusion protein